MVVALPLCICYSEVLPFWVILVLREGLASFAVLERVVFWYTYKFHHFIELLRRGTTLLLMRGRYTPTLWLNTYVDLVRDGRPLLLAAAST